MGTGTWLLKPNAFIMIMLFLQSYSGHNLSRPIKSFLVPQLLTCKRPQKKKVHFRKYKFWLSIDQGNHL